MTRLIDADKLYPDVLTNKGTLAISQSQVANAPTINPTTIEDRPKGEWEIVDAEGGKIWNCVCTECGHDPQEYICGTEDWWLRKPLPNFCPNCGARIVKVRGDDE